MSFFPKVTLHVITLLEGERKVDIVRSEVGVESFHDLMLTNLFTKKNTISL